MAVEMMNDLNYLVVLQQSNMLSQEHRPSEGQEFYELGQTPFDRNRTQLQSQG